LQTEIGEDEEHGDLKKTGKCDTTRTEKEGVADADSCRRKCVPYVTRRSLIHGVLSQVKSWKKDLDYEEEETEILCAKGKFYSVFISYIHFTYNIYKSP